MAATYSIKQLLSLWNILSDIPVDEGGEFVDQDFLHFKAGDEVMDIWRWFEEQHPNFSAGLTNDGYIVDVVGYESAGSGGFDWYFNPEDADKAFLNENKPVNDFSDEGYTAFRFKAMVSTLDSEKATAQIDKGLEDFYITADEVNGKNPNYSKARATAISRQTHAQKR